MTFIKELNCYLNMALLLDKSSPVKEEPWGQEDMEKFSKTEILQLQE